MTAPVRHVFEPRTMDDAKHILAAAAGAYCIICRRTPWPAHLTYKNLAVCAPCAPAARQGELMNDVTSQEAAAGMDAIDCAGAYLESIGKFDLRDLTDAELAEFNAHYIAGFGDSMRERARSSPPF